MAMEPSPLRATTSETWILNWWKLGELISGSWPTACASDGRRLASSGRQIRSGFNRLRTLVERLDFNRELTKQLAWREEHDDRPVRIVYTSAGRPTAALLQDFGAIVDHRLYWTTCRDHLEAHYLVTIINSNRLYEAVSPFMSKGQYGARDLHQHLWKLPIPAFNSANSLHMEIAMLGTVMEAGVARELAALHTEREDVSVALARKELRSWLRTSPEGAAVEAAVGRLLAGDSNRLLPVCSSVPRDPDANGNRLAFDCSEMLGDVGKGARSMMLLAPFHYEFSRSQRNADSRVTLDPQRASRLVDRRAYARQPAVRDRW